MSLLASLFMLAALAPPATATSDVAAPSDVGTAHPAEDELLYRSGGLGSGKAKGGSKKKKGQGNRSGAKKGKKKTGKGKKGRSLSPWGRATVVVGAAAGGTAGQVRETNNAGRDDVKVDGTCGREHCEPSNTAPGFGRFAEVSLLYVGSGGQPRTGGPLVRFNRWNMSLEGAERPRPESADEAAVLGDVTDRASYAITLNQLDLGLATAQKYKAGSPWFFYLEATGSYVRGPMTTTLDSAPQKPVDGTVSGFAWGLQFSHCLSLSKQLHVFLTPLDLDIRYLRARDDASFPFLGDGKATLSAATAKVGVAGAF